MTALEMQWELLDLARKYAEDRGLEAVGDEVGRDVLAPVGDDADARSRSTPCSSRASSTGWPSTRCSTPTATGTACDWDDHKLAAMDLQYHDIRPERSLFARLDIERLVTEESVDRRRSPSRRRDTRAYFRGRCLQRWASSIAAANWDSMVFDLGSRPAAPGAHDGAAQRNRGPRRYVVGRMREPRRAVGAAGLIGGSSFVMAEREQKKKPAPARKQDDVEDEAAPAASKQGEKIKAELDDLLDEIDEVLEDNAEEFVRSYVQKGGQ